MLGVSPKKNRTHAIQQGEAECFMFKRGWLEKAGDTARTERRVAI
jgi:hypothetical protein